MTKNRINPKVDFYFSKAQKWQKELEKLRMIVLDCGLAEELKWGVPCYTFQKSNIVLIHVFKEYCALLFPKGTLLNDTHGILVQPTKNKQAARQIRFTSVQEIAEMEPVLKAHIHETIQKRLKPPYLLGLLGFIPLVGFFVGLGLMLYGIIKYKNRKLTLIGIACMFFTVFVYSLLFHISSVSGFGKKGWEKNAQMQLNGLIKNIEYYKIENGKYPDSLKQLDNKNEFVFMVDPTQATKNKKGVYYNYKNLGDKYILFSSGTDGIPNTKDDIYPQIKNLKNVGWTKNP